MEQDRRNLLPHCASTSGHSERQENGMRRQLKHWHGCRNMRVIADLEPDGNARRAKPAPMPGPYISPDGRKTGEWIRSQLRFLQRGGRREWRRAKPAELGRSKKSIIVISHEALAERTDTGVIANEAI